MKLIFLAAAFAVCILTGCSSQGAPQLLPPLSSQSPSTASTPFVSSTPTPTPSRTPLTDAEKQNRDQLAKELDRIDLEFRERQEKLEQERRENKLCRSQQALADFSPNDKEELSPECKKRLADLEKQNR